VHAATIETTDIHIVRATSSWTAWHFIAFNPVAVQRRNSAGGATNAGSGQVAVDGPAARIRTKKAGFLSNLDEGPQEGQTP
jgi:hypothetical protein